MPFDPTTRTRLATFVREARTVIADEFTQQFQAVYGISPSGDITPLEKLTHLDEAGRATAALLRERIDYLISSYPSEKNAAAAAVSRLAREQSFTILNRLAAIRMAEKRKLIVESVGKGYQSAGFRVYESVAGTGLGDAYHRYRFYLFCLFDELAVDLGILFDRRSATGLLFPREPALLRLLELLNAHQIEELWAEDETIGWIYQYFNGNEVKEMREAVNGGPPRNSRELAVRNQFFTPRYVVEFLTDNTLGRLWYEMTRGATILRDRCRYLVRRPTEIFLNSGQAAPASAAGSEAETGENLSQEELLRQPVHILHRPLKDPREIRLLDPACGSMHFGLYAFDLFTVIYDEAWEIAHGSDAGVKSVETFAPFVAFAASFPDKVAFLREVPRLIVERNIHGIDIDPRAAQIAGLSLWLRAQRAWLEAGVKPADRPRITRSNLVCAEPMPGDKELLSEFIEQQFPAGERPAFTLLLGKIFDCMTLAGEAGSLLRIEEEIHAAIAEAKRIWKEGPKHEQASLFSGATEKPGQGEMRLDLSGITDEQFWGRAEQRIYDALETYAEQAENGGGFQRRLFADDAAQGFAFIDLCRKRYDVAVMNPPFGDSTPAGLTMVRRDYPEYAENLYVAFHSRAQQVLAPGGLTGIISSRTFVTYRDFEKFRANLLGQSPIQCFADLGWEVLDGAQVETAAYVTAKAGHSSVHYGPFFRLLAVPLDKKDQQLLIAVQLKEADRTFFASKTVLNLLPGSPLCYWTSPEFVIEIAKAPSLYPSLAFVGLGASPHAFFFRSWWEVSHPEVGNRWKRICRGGDFAPFYRANTLVIDWHRDGGSVKEYILKKYPYLNGNYGWKIQDEDKYGRPGLTWGKRNERFNVQAMPAGHTFTDEGQGIVPLDPGNTVFLLGYMNSALVAYFLSLTSGLQKHYVYIRPVPVIQFSNNARNGIEAATSQILERKRRWDATSEISPLYLLPTPSALTIKDGVLASHSSCVGAWRDDAKSINAMCRDIDDAVFSETKLSSEDIAEVRGLRATFPADAPNVEGFIPGVDDKKALAAAVFSYVIGSVFGRWDIRYATGERSAPGLPDAFAALPICPPGMLQGDDGLPLSAEEGRKLYAAGQYPLDVAWDGILVDDQEDPLDLKHRADADIERRVHAALAVLWGNRTDDLEHEACAMLGVSNLREWFRRPAGFFADHLKRYSKSRRQAPIYWPLSTASGSYTLWLYYHRLTDQTLHTALADFLDPKLRSVQSQIRALKDNNGSRTKLEQLLDLEAELTEMRTEIDRIIRLPWKPNLNDGVRITASPLWQLFRFSPWRNGLQACWQELQDGDYDWAHLAYTLRPEPVRQKCQKDRSLAIAHGLESICEVEAPKPKAKRGKKAKTEPAEETPDFR